MSEELPKFTSNYKNRNRTDEPKSLLEKYEDEVNSYKLLLSDKTHPDNKSDAYKKNERVVMNRLVESANNLDAETEGNGVFGLIILALRTALALKDQNTVLEVKVRDLEKKLKRVEKAK